MYTALKEYNTIYDPYKKRPMMFSLHSRGPAFISVVPVNFTSENATETVT
jgi:hypothetical protein